MAGRQGRRCPLRALGPANGTATPPDKAPSNGNGHPKPNVASEEQQKQIRQLADELGLDVDIDIMKRIGLSWPPLKKDADGIIKRLREKKTEATRK